jgi:hypothetical protein
MQDEPHPHEMTSTELYDHAADLLFRAFQGGDPVRHEALKLQAWRFKKLGELHEAKETAARHRPADQLPAAAISHGPPQRSGQAARPKAPRSGPAVRTAPAVTHEADRA